MQTLTQRSLLSELRAILAVANKEWTIFRRYPTWIAAFLFWPVMFPLAAIMTARALGGPSGTGFGAFAQLAGTPDYVAYIALGNTVYMWMNITLWGVGLTLRNEQMRGTLESNWLCPVWRISMVVGQSLQHLATSLVFLAITFVEFWLVFGVQIVRGHIGLALLVLALLVPCIYGIGIVFGSLVLRFKEPNAMVFLVRGLVMIFCGVSYPLAVLPGWMQTVAQYIPLTYAIQGIRDIGLRGATLAELGPTLTPLAWFAVLLPLLGFVTFTVTERRARRTGALGQY